jgi:hypothetical protein
MAGSAWVLSRQVIRRDLVDWDTWRRFKHNIYFPMIVAGRAVLKAPAYYLAEPLVHHTWFNAVFWHQFGRDQVDIEYNLARDRFLAMRAILHDVPVTSETQSVVDAWELASLRRYVHLHPFGLYDLARQTGWGLALRRVRQDLALRQGTTRELTLALAAMPFTRLRYLAGRAARQLPEPIVRVLLRLTGRPA